MCARGIEPTSSEKATAHTEPSLQTFNFTNVFVCLWLCLCVCGGGDHNSKHFSEGPLQTRQEDTGHHAPYFQGPFCFLSPSL